MPRQAIFFLTDTQGANLLGSYTGTTEFQTPRLDQLAKEGVRFEHPYSCSPICGPARSAIFTGLFPHSNGVIANHCALQTNMPTVGQRLSAAGVHTAYIGKWHLDGLDYFGDGRCPPGWDRDYWFDGRNYLDSLPDQNARDLSRKMLGPEEVAKYNITEDFTHAHRCVDKAIDFITKHQDEDFFLVVSLDEPHHPAICPEPYASAFLDYLLPIPNFEDSLETKPQLQREWSAGVEPIFNDCLVMKDGKAYFHAPWHFGCNSYVDYEIGRALDAVSKHTPDAMIVHSSDHGDAMGSHHLSGKGPAVYEEIARIPLIIRWSGEAQADAVSTPPVSHIDLVPTFLEFFGLDRPPILQGKSLLPQLRNPAVGVNDAIFIEFHRGEICGNSGGGFVPFRAIFDGRYKLVINLLDTDELYDLKEDPSEITNFLLDPAYAEIRDALHDKLLAWMDDTRDPFRGLQWRNRDWRATQVSGWLSGGRVRPHDEAYFPRTLRYETGREAPASGRVE